MSQKKDKNKILFFRESVFEVSKLIFDYPNKTFHIRMLEKETGFSTTAVVDSINELKKYGIVQMEETPLTTNVKADLESEAYRFYKLIFNLYRIKRYLFIDGLVEKLNNPESIVLFGSFSKGEDAEQSDIDILVISPNKPDERLQDFVDIFEKELNRNINLHILKSLDKSSDEFKNTVANGIVLHGYLKII